VSVERGASVKQAVQECHLIYLQSSGESALVEGPCEAGERMSEDCQDIIEIHHLVQGLLTLPTLRILKYFGNREEVPCAFHGAWEPSCLRKAVRRYSDIGPSSGGRSVRSLKPPSFSTVGFEEAESLWLRSRVSRPDRKSRGRLWTI
jgi:hypothetical protein